MSAEYKLHQNGYIIRYSDGAWIPPVAGNADYQEFQAWIAAGNEPDPADPPADAPSLPGGLAIPAGPTQLEKLITTLTDKGVISSADADYVLGVESPNPL